MKKHNIMLGIGLLGAASLSSCKEEVFDGLENNNKGEYKHYSAEMGLDTFSADKKDGSRANVKDDGKSFMWNTGDAVSIWDGTATGNFRFSAPADYDDSTPKSKLVFSGEASLTDGATVWGVYPYTESEGVFADKSVKFTLPENATQDATGKPGLQNTMFMMAEGTVSGSNIEKLNFHHLTGIFQFNITNNGEEAVTVSSVKVSANSALFPTVVTATVGGEGISYAYSKEKEALTLKFAETQTIEPEKSLSGYMSILPSKVTADTELTLYVNDQEIKKGTVKELYGSSSSVTANGYEVGKRYVINLTTVKVKPDNGYEINEKGEYEVFAPKGLAALVEKFGDSKTVIRLTENMDMSALAETRSAYVWESKDFAGTFDGNGKTISNVAVSGTDAGFFKVNTGTIKNLKLSNITVEGTPKDANNFAGIMAGKNSGTIEGCEVTSSTVSISGSGTDGNIGGFVGWNEKTITDSKITNVTVTANAPARTAGFVGYNTGSILGSASAEGVNLTVSHKIGNKDIGGLIGWNGNNGKVHACYSFASITVENAAQKIGGLIGSAGNSNNIAMCYSAGKISIEASAGGSTAGGLIGKASDAWSKPVNVNSCYTVTTMPQPVGGSTVSGFVGKNDSTNGQLICNECYFTNHDKAIQNGDFANVTKTIVEDLKGKAETMNSAAGVTGYHFVSGTRDIPLTIEKVTK